MRQLPARTQLLRSQLVTMAVQSPMPKWRLLVTMAVQGPMLKWRLLVTMAVQSPMLKWRRLPVAAAKRRICATRRISQFLRTRHFPQFLRTPLRNPRSSRSQLTLHRSQIRSHHRHLHRGQLTLHRSPRTLLRTCGNPPRRPQRVSRRRTHRRPRRGGAFGADSGVAPVVLSELSPATPPWQSSRRRATTASPVTVLSAQSPALLPSVLKSPETIASPVTVLSAQSPALLPSHPSREGQSS